MNLLFYSDPHLGQVRKANMTAESNLAKEQLNGKRLSLLLSQEGAKFCLGDFFDKESNPEEIILGAMDIARQTDVILAGNHDIPNRAGKASSLKLLEEVFPGKVLIADPEAPEGFSSKVEGTLLCFAPHAMTQEAYDAIIADLVEEADQHSGTRILCLHCNYNLPEAFVSENVLNLTEAAALSLLAHFHYILIGHVHTAEDHFEGRLKLIGSVFPTAFDNLDRKRALFYDTETFTFREFVTWDPEHHLFTGNASAVSAGPMNPDLEYFDLFNDLPPGEAQKLVVHLFKEGAFGVRLRQPEVEEQAQPEITSAHFEQLPNVIEAELHREKPKLYPIWKELRELVE